MPAKDTGVWEIDRTSAPAGDSAPPDYTPLLQASLEPSASNIGQLQEALRGTLERLQFLGEQHQSALEAALVAADLRKDVFLATLSHELRNPLAPIRMAAQILQSPKLKPGQLEEVQTIISRQVRHMSSLLDDLLDVSRITRGSFILKKDYVQLHELLDDAVTAVQEAIDAKHHALRIDNPVPKVTLEADPVRLTQVITNVLTNAIKYTPAGGVIQLVVRLEARELTIAVRDSGVGLTPEAMDRVFDMFTRVDSELGRAEGGLGVGLALSKGLVEAHGGSIEARSAGINQGSEFVIHLPRTLLVDSSVRPKGQAGNGELQAAARRILVADDNQDSARTMKMLLAISGHEVHVCHSGTEALEVARRIRPDVAVLDIGMPDLSGYDVAEVLRREAWGKEMILIAVTGWGQDADKRRALAAGFNHHLTKPIDFDGLERLFDAG